MPIPSTWRMHGFIVLAWLQFFGLTAIATYYLLTPSPGDTFAHVWDKALHFACWFILLMSLQLPWLFRRKLWAAALVLFAYSALLEGLQFFSPPREFSVGDMLANGLGILVAWSLLHWGDPLLQRFVRPYLLNFLTEESP